MRRAGLVTALAIVLLAACAAARPYRTQASPAEQLASSSLRSPPKPWADAQRRSRRLMVDARGDGASQCIPLEELILRTRLTSVTLSAAYPSPSDRRVLKDAFKGRPSCALVGNAGALAKHKFGAAIDGHGIVIRMNHAPVGRGRGRRGGGGGAGLKAQVGTRSNVRLLNIMNTRRYGSRRLRCQVGKNTCTAGGRPEGGTLVSTRLGKSHALCRNLRRVRRKTACQETRVVWAASKLLSLYRLSLKECARQQRHRYPPFADQSKVSPSTGFLGFFLAALVQLDGSKQRGLCSAVTLFGFAGGAASDPKAYKYHGMGRMTGYASHNFGLEQHLMHAVGKLQVRNASSYAGLPLVAACSASALGGGCLPPGA